MASHLPQKRVHTPLNLLKTYRNSYWISEYKSLEAWASEEGGMLLL